MAMRSPSAIRLNAGQMGPRGNAVASRLAKEADVILALGTRLGFNSTFYSYDNINEAAEIIQVELEPTAIGRYFPVARRYLGRRARRRRCSSRDAVANFAAARRGRGLDRGLQARSARPIWKSAMPKPQSQEQPIQPSGLFKALRGALPKNAAVTMDAGTLCLQATDALNYWEPPCLFTPLDFGLVGFSFACGLGVKIARPGQARWSA